jgi:vancomycin resistance protein VanJ
MENPLKPITWLLGLTGIYAAILAGISLLNWSGADRYWFGAFNLYLPQFLWAVPGIVLAILIFHVERRLVWFPLLCIAWVVGPLMGLRWSADAAPAAGRQQTVRLMTWNIKYTSYPLAPLIEELERSRPDLVLFQDAIGAAAGPLARQFQGWQVYSHGQYVIASRYPLSDFEVHELPRYGEGHEFLRCRLHLGDQVVSLYNVHLKTPRRGLNEFRTARKQPWHLPTAIESFTHNVETRQLQSRVVAELLKRERGPVLLAGDLNATEETLVFKELRGAGLRDCFTEQGQGYGYTYGHLLFKYRLPWLKLSWMRIDHVMVNGGFRTLRCWAGSAAASDHRPVLADLVLVHP